MEDQRSFMVEDPLPLGHDLITFIEKIILAEADIAAYGSALMPLLRQVSDGVGLGISPERWCKLASAPLAAEFAPRPAE